MGRPPIRSASQPQNCRPRNAAPSITESISAPCAGAMPRSLQNATRCTCGIAIGTQQRKAAAQSSASIARWLTPSRPRAAPAARGGNRAGAAAGGGRSRQQRERQDHHRLEAAEGQHRLAPAQGRDAALEQGRPERAGDVLAARDQRQRRAAPAVEPAADIDESGGLMPPVPSSAEQQPVAEPQRPHPATRRDCEAAADITAPNATVQRTPMRSAIRPGDAADPGAEPGHRAGQRRHRARHAEFGGDRLQRHHHQQRRAVGDRHQAQCGE